MEDKRKEFCGDCPFLTPTELQQSNKKEPHFCNLYRHSVKHLGYHPQLPRLDICLERNNYMQVWQWIESYGEAKKLEGMIEESKYWLKKAQIKTMNFLQFENRLHELTQHLEELKK